MALQGTIETFALPDVLRLLATTKKTGRLRLSGSRGSGSVWLDAGAVVASEATGAPHATGPTDVVFELLRFKEGEFEFDDTDTASAPEKPADVESVLGEAEKMLEEWQAIEAVVPSLDGWLTLAGDLPDDEVTIARSEWRSLVAIAGGRTVGALGDVLEQGELDVCRTVKELIERDLVELGDAPAGVATGAAASAGAAPAMAPEAEAEPEPFEPLVFDETPEPEAAPAVETYVEEVADEVVEFEPVIEIEEEARPALEVVPALADDEPEPFDPGGLVIEDTAPEPEPAAATEEPEMDAAEIARQLASLSPKAAKAVAAAAKASTEEERMAALAEVSDDEAGFNRDLLLKFLDSMNP